MVCLDMCVCSAWYHGAYRLAAGPLIAVSCVLFAPMQVEPLFGQVEPVANSCGHWAVEEELLASAWSDLLVPHDVCCTADCRCVVMRGDAVHHAGSRVPLRST